MKVCIFFADSIVFSGISAMGTIGIPHTFTDPVCGFESQLRVTNLMNMENICIVVPHYCTLFAQEKG